MTPQQFVHTWKHSQLKEKSGAQPHFIDLCRLVGHPAPHEADPSGESFTFEAFATKQSGYQGYADVLETVAIVNALPPLDIRENEPS